MSSSVGLNVLRWSALGLGVFYGLSHQISISSRDKLAKAKHEFDQQQNLIQQAKQEWARSHPSEAPKASAKGDPQDPNADLNTILGITDDK